jgi:hypothetical protein
VINHDEVGAGGGSGRTRAISSSEAIYVLSGIAYPIGPDHPHQIINDGKVVGCQIPNHVGVMLENPQIDSRRIVIVEGSESVVIDQFTNLAHSSAEQERMVHHDQKFLPGGKFDKFLGLARILSKWLLDKDVLSILQSLLRKRKVMGDRSHDGNGIDCRIVENVGGIHGDFDGWVALAHSLQ